MYTKQITVEQIHAEFDAAEQKTIDSCNALLEELQIPVESHIEKKATNLMKLGFKNSETIKKASGLCDNRKKIEDTRQLTTFQLETILELKQKYPLEKFISVKDMEFICEKYGLIHAPSKNYIKDIPEKNVNEMLNAKKLEQGDRLEVKYILSDIEDLNAWKDMGFTVKGKEVHVTDFEIIPKMIKAYGRAPKDWLPSADSDMWAYLIAESFFISNYRYKSIRTIDESGIFVAAPKSHFNLDGLKKNSKFGFFKVDIREVKDPIAFEYCKEGLVRIITKWGTDDDQSYLDPLLTNEILN